MIRQTGYMVKGADGDPGYDLVNDGPSVTIAPGDTAIINTKVSVDLPRQIFGLLTHRSSLAFKKGCILSLGIIDSNFKGDIRAVVFNLSHYAQTIESGERFAQFIPLPTADMGLTPSLSLETGDKEGFGSTGS